MNQIQKNRVKNGSFVNQREDEEKKKKSTTPKKTEPRRDSSGIWQNQTPVTGDYFGSNKTKTVDRPGRFKSRDNSSPSKDRRETIADKHKGQRWSSRTGGYVETPKTSVGGIDWNTAKNAQQKAKKEETPTTRKSVGGIDYSKANAAKKNAGSQNISDMREQGYNKYLEDQKRKKKDAEGLSKKEYESTIQPFLDSRKIETPDDVFNTSGDVADYLKSQIDDLDKQIEAKSLSVTKSADPQKTIKETDELRSRRDRLTATMNQFKNESVYSKGVQQVEYNYDSDAKSSYYSAQGAKMDSTLHNLTDEEWAQSMARSIAIGMNEEDTLKAASRLMTDKEWKVYDSLLYNEGEKSANRYVLNLYQYGDLGQRTAEAANTITNTDLINTKGMDGTAKGAAEVINTGVRGFLRYGGSFTSGVGNAIEGLGDAVTRAVDADYVHAENVGKKLYAYRKQEDPNDIGIDIAFNTGNMMPAIVVSVATEGAGAPAVVSAIASASVTGVSTFGNEYQEARRQGYSKDEATSYAVVNGVSEAALQYALNGVAAMAGGGVTKAAENAVVSKAQNVIQRLCKTEASQAMMNKLVMAGVGSFGEFEEEYLQAVLEPVFRNAFLGELTMVEPFSENTLYQGALGALSAAGMNVASVASQTMSENALGKRFRGDALNKALGSRLVTNLPEGTDLKTRAQYIMENGAENVPDGTVGRFMMAYNEQAKANAQIQAASKGLLAWNDINDTGRKLLVDPRNAQYIKDTFGVEVDETMTPQQMKQAFINKAVESSRNYAENYEEVISFLKGDIKKSQLSDGALEIVGDPNVVAWMIDQYDIDTANLSPEARSAALDALVNKIAGVELTEEQRAEYEAIRDELIAEEIPYDKDTSEIPAVKKLENFLYSVNETPMTRAERGAILDTLPGYNSESSVSNEVDLNDPESVTARITELMDSEQTEETQNELEYYKTIHKDRYDAAYRAKNGEETADRQEQRQAKTPKKNVKRQVPNIAVAADTSDVALPDSDAAILNEAEKGFLIFKLSPKDINSNAMKTLKAIQEQRPDLYEQAYENVFGTIPDADTAGLMENMIERLKAGEITEEQYNAGMDFLFDNLEVKQPAQTEAPAKFATDREALNAQTLIDYKPKKKTKAQKKARSMAALEAAAIEVSDSLAPMAGMGKAVKSRKIYDSANAVRNAPAAAMFNLGKSIIGKRSGHFANIKGDNVGKSLDAVFRPLYKLKNSKITQDFFSYLRALDNAERTAQGRAKIKGKNGEFLTVKQSKALAQEILEDLQADPDAKDLFNKMVDYTYEVPVRDENGEFVLDKDGKIKTKKVTEKNVPEIAADVWTYARNLLDYRYDSGLITKDAYDRMRWSHPHYVPTEQAFTTDDTIPGTKEIGNVSKTVQRDTGAEPVAEFNAIDDVLARQTINVIANARKNMMMNAIASERTTADGKLDAWVYDVYPDAPYGNPVLKESMLQGELDNFFNDELLQMREADRKAGTISYLENGKRMLMRVSDNVIKAFNSFNQDVTKFEKAMSKVNNVYRNLITSYNPFFMARNFFRDMDAFFFSTDTPKFVKYFFGPVWKQMTTNGDVWQLYESTGATNASFYGNPSEKGGGMKAERNLVQKILFDKIEMANLIVEQGPRFAEFMATLENRGCLKNGKLIRENITPDILNEAAYNANEITVNFARGGRVVKRVNNAGATFFNASIQGATKYARYFSNLHGKQWLSVAAKMAVMGMAPQLLNSIMYDDDDEYQKMTDYYKDNFFCWKIGDGQWLYIPYPRFLETIKSAVRRVYDISKGRDVDWGSYVESVNNNIAPANPLTQNIAYPAIRNLLMNKTWFNSDIDTEWELKHPEDAYNEKTSKVVKFMADGIGMSPKRLQDLVDSYGGVVADWFLTATSNEGQVEYPGAGWLIAPLLKSFTKDMQLDYTGTQSDWYSYKEAVQVRREDEEGEYGENVSTPGDYVSYYMTAQQKLIAEQKDKMTEINNDPSIPRDDKKDLVDALRINLSALYATSQANAEKLEELIDKYWDVDPEANAEVQKRQAAYANLQANYDLFGAKGALESAGVKDEKLTDLVNSGVDLDSYYTYYKNMVSSDAYMTVDKDGKGHNLTDSEKAKILVDSKVGDEQTAAIYSSDIENANTSEKHTMEYASKHGLKAKTFISAKAAFADIDDRIKKEEEAGAEFRDGEAKARKSQWILDNVKGSDAMVTLYETQVESGETNTIREAEKQGVRPEMFLKRNVQKQTEEGDKTGTVTRTPYMEDGVVKYKEDEDYVPGSMTEKAMHDLLTSGYTDEEKKYFYGSEFYKDTKFQWIMQTGMSVDKYLKAREATATLSADKDANGEAINGTKRPKVEAALRSAGLSGTEYYIAMMREGYTLTHDEYMSVAKDILGRGLTPEKKTAVLTGLGYKIKDGKVYSPK